MNVDPGQLRAELQAVEDAANQVLTALAGARQVLTIAEADEAATEPEADDQADDVEAEPVEAEPETADE